jgi:adenylate kinase family enzyme
MARIHIFGASGSGTTTLGAALAARLGCPHEDTDTYFWLPTDPPFTTPRQTDARLALLLPRLSGPAWVVSGSAGGWMAPAEPLYDLVVLLRLDPILRMHRLRLRETARFGARIAPGGDMAVASKEFFDWAASYDTAGLEQRSLAAHEQWLAARTCPVLRLDSAAPLEQLIVTALGHLPAGARLPAGSPLV